MNSAFEICDRCNRVAPSTVNGLCAHCRQAERTARRLNDHRERTARANGDKIISINKCKGVIHHAPIGEVVI